jgi:hypothetical protein
MLSISKKWTNTQLIENIQDKFNVKSDDFDLDSINLSIDKGEGADDVDDLTEIEEKQKLIIDIKQKESATKAKAPSPKKAIPAKPSMMSSLQKPKIGGLASKPIVR